MLRSQTFIPFFSLLSIATAIDYECLPYPVASVCRIEYVSYHPGDQITFPTGYQQFHIISPRSTNKITSKVKTFDSELYQAMHCPTSIEMTNTEMETLVLPPGLMLGDFSDNHLAQVNTSNTGNYQITYLDLSSNGLYSIDFISRLVNLEVLHLDSNIIESIPSSALRPLTKLKYLYLQYNSFSSFPWTDLPRSMIHLDCYMGIVSEADFSNISLPALKYLNLQYNMLTTINVTELLRVAPQLREAHLYNTYIDDQEMVNIMDELTSNNISFVDPYGWCKNDDHFEMVFGNCVRRPSVESSVSIGKAVLLSILVIGIAALFVYILLLVFRHMNR